MRQALVTAVLLLAACGGSTQRPAPITVTVSPGTAGLFTRTSRTFTVTVTGATDSAVGWSVAEGVTGGTVTPAGRYTAPPTSGTYHVVATSRADATRSDRATVTVTDPAGGWLRVSGNQLLLPGGLPFHGRGANLHDTRGCGACTYDTPNPAEVNRRIDLAVDGWGANFIRLALESYGSAGARSTGPACWPIPATWPISRRSWPTP